MIPRISLKDINYSKVKNIEIGNLSVNITLKDGSVIIIDSGTFHDNLIYKYIDKSGRLQVLDK